MVKYQYGPGYPVYQYEQTVVLSGKDGSKISRTLTDSLGSQSSPISISLRGRGNDIFIHWLSNCKGHDKEKLFYSFPKGILLRKKKQIPAEFLLEIVHFSYSYLQKHVHPLLNPVSALFADLLPCATVCLIEKFLFF